MAKMSTMKLSDTTKERLAEYGKFGETYETVINRVLDMLKEYEEKSQKNSNESPRKASVTA